MRFVTVGVLTSIELSHLFLLKVGQSLLTFKKKSFWT